MSNQDGMEDVRDLLERIVKELVDSPEGVSVQHTVSNGGGTVVMTVKAAHGETGKVIGKAGRNASAIRVLLDSFAAKRRRRIVLEIDDPRRRGRERSTNARSDH